MKSPENMTRDELIKYNGHLKKMIHGLQIQLTKALDELVRIHDKGKSGK